MTFEYDTPCPRPSAPPPAPPPIQVPPFFYLEYPTRSSPTTPIPTMNNISTSNDQINITSAVSTANKLPSHSPGPWSSGLCDCCDDIHSCCLTCCCPCVAFGRIAEIVDRGSTSCGVSGALYALILCVTGCSCLYSCFYRSKLRGQYFLDERPCTDCCIHCCCEECALCQEYRELKNQGVDMSIGWHGNMERQKRGLIVPPSMEGAMKR